MIDPRTGGTSSQQRQSAPIDQLCYTWSTVGYNSSLGAGFRIRAASPRLQAINDDRVKGLNRYLRYSLPEGADRFEVQKSLEQAPICLALLQSEHGERILVHKKYIGQDGVNRLGNFFIHLLAGLPREFSVKDAIALWRSPFWYVSDQGLGSSIQLNPLSPTELVQYDQRYLPQPIEILRPPGVDNVLVENNPFAHFLLVYLQWRRRWERCRASLSAELPRLYIAAPPDMFAAFLYGLTICLPWQLLTDLTFSTYEEDIRKSQALLVGTCWLPSSQGSIDPTRDLPRECYNSDRSIALNCYRLSRTELKPQESQDHHFVNYVAQCLKSGNVMNLQTLVSNTGRMGQIAVDSFLNEYYDFIVDAFNLTPEKVEDRLALPDKAASMLGEPTAQEWINTWALSETSWCIERLIPSLKKLPMQAKKHPRLAGALQAYAVSVSDRACKAVERRQDDQFSAMMSILSAIAPPEGTTNVWQNLLEDLKQRLGKTLQLFSNNNHCYYKFLQLLGKVSYINIDNIAPILKIYWKDSENFFLLDIPLEWKRVAFLAHPISTLGDGHEEISKQDCIKYPGDNFKHFLRELEKVLTSDEGWSDVKAVFVQLAQYNYPYKLVLLNTLLKSPMSLGREQELVEQARLLPTERRQFLQNYGPIAIPSLQPEAQAILWDQWKEYCRAQKEAFWKKEILYSWLPSLDSAGWFSKPANFELLLEKVGLASEDNRALLEDYGASLFERYARQDPQWFSPKEFRVLTASIEDFVNNFSIEARGKDQFLPSLQTEPFASLPRNVREGVDNLSLLRAFLAHPSLDEHTLTGLTSALCWVSPKKDAVLIERLAKAFARCVKGETHLVRVVIIIIMEVMSKPTSSFSQFDLLQLLYSMAEQVGYSIVNSSNKANRYTKDQFLAYIRFVLCFKDLYAALSPSEYIHFLMTFFSLLLQFTNEESLAHLDMHLHHCKKWKRYKEWYFPELIQSAKDGSFMQSSAPEIFLAQPSSTMASLILLSRNLASKSLREGSMFVETLAESFVSSVEESETYLALAMTMVINEMNKPGSSFSKFDLLQLLYGMAEKIRDYGTSEVDKDALQDLLLSYVRFALCFDDVYSGLFPCEYNHFLITFLDLLLQSANEEGLTLLNQHLCGFEKWNTYMKSRLAKPGSARNGMKVQQQLKDIFLVNKVNNTIIDALVVKGKFYDKSEEYTENIVITPSTQSIDSTEQVKSGREYNMVKSSVLQKKIFGAVLTALQWMDKTWLKFLIDGSSKGKSVNRLSRKKNSEQDRTI